MLLNHGHCKIEWGGNEYNISPSLQNISKIGSPIEIIEDFKSFISSTSPSQAFSIAINVINCCSDKDLPTELTGRFRLNSAETKLVYVMPSHGLPMFDDVLTLAEHCFLHGVCGKSGKKGDGDPLTEFNAYEIMAMARVNLEISASEAANMTMTELVIMMDAMIKVKHPNAKEDNKMSVKEEDSLIDLFEKHNGVH